MAEQKDSKYASFSAKGDNKFLSEIPVPVSTAHNPARPCCQRKGLWKKIAIRLIVAALVVRVLFVGLGSFFYSNVNESISDFTAESEPHDSLLPPIWEPSPECEPTIEWQGAKKSLVDPDQVDGLVYNVEGSSSRGSVTIRQDPLARGYITITNKILLSEASLQEDVKVAIDITDQDFSMTVKTPSWDGPRPTKRCVRIDTEIVIPGNIKHFKSLAVDVPNAWISAKDVNDIEFAYVNLKSSNGRVEVKKLKVANGEISTTNGRINGGFLVSENIEIKNVNGAIDTNVHISPWADNVGIVTRSVNGPIDIHVCDFTDKQTINVYARSMNGGVDAGIDDNFFGNFSVSTLVGYSAVEGSKLHFSRNTRIAKAGYKGDDDEEREASSVKLESITGSIELSFH